MVLFLLHSFLQFSNTPPSFPSAPFTPFNLHIILYPSCPRAVSDVQQDCLIHLLSSIIILLMSSHNLMAETITTCKWLNNNVVL